MSSQVRNLRAMFEQKGEGTSSPDRGRSPAMPTTPSGSDSPRPISKIRSSFVLIEKDGRVGLQRGDSNESVPSLLRNQTSDQPADTPSASQESKTQSSNDRVGSGAKQGGDGRADPGSKQGGGEASSPKTLATTPGASPNASQPNSSPNAARTKPSSSAAQLDSSPSSRQLGTAKDRRTDSQGDQEEAKTGTKDSAGSGGATVTSGVRHDPRNGSGGHPAPSSGPSDGLSSDIEASKRNTPKADATRLQPERTTKTPSSSDLSAKSPAVQAPTSPVKPQTPVHTLRSSEFHQAATSHTTPSSAKTLQSTARKGPPAPIDTAPPSQGASATRHKPKTPTIPTQSTSDLMEAGTAPTASETNGATRTPQSRQSGSYYMPPASSSKKSSPPADPDSLERGIGFVKPKPKSPTKPVQLPAGLTTHTSASATKGSRPTDSRQSVRRTSSSATNRAPTDPEVLERGIGFVKPKPKSPTKPAQLPAGLTTHTSSSAIKGSRPTDARHNTRRASSTIGHRVPSDPSLLERGIGFVKPKPKSPTKPAQLPAGLTTHTSSSATKGSRPTDARQASQRASSSVGNRVPSDPNSLERGIGFHKPKPKSPTKPVQLPPGLMTHTSSSATKGSRPTDQRQSLHLAPSSATNRATSDRNLLERGVGFVKPKPKSPTRPAQLPASLMTHTASSVGKLRDTARQSLQPAALRPSSRASNMSAANGERALRRQSSHLGIQSRPSLGPPPRQATSSSSREAREVDPEMLERVMRPTQSSASRSRDVSTTPPRKVSPASSFEIRTENTPVKMRGLSHPAPVVEEEMPAEGRAGEDAPVANGHQEEVV